jgi:hypothetical protein
MNSVRSYHDEAIRSAQMAMVALQQGKQEEHQKLIQRAMQFETNAANLVPDEKSAEPTRSILYRSAASFAYQAGDYAEAERLVFKGLAGYPPAAVKQQLLDVQQMIQTALGYHQAGNNGHVHPARQIVTAVYANGALHPTTSLTLHESQLVAIEVLPDLEEVAL